MSKNYTIGNSRDKPVILTKASGKPIEILSGAISKGVDLNEEQAAEVERTPGLDITEDR